MEDRKYRLAFVNRVSGEPMPEDEPVFVLRARDKKALATLRFYRAKCEDEHHRQAIQETIEDFEVFWSAHPERMKEPGTTHQFTHATSPVHDADISQASRDLALVDSGVIHGGYWIEKHGKKLLVKIEHQKARMTALLDALGRAESWFRRYAEHHKAKIPHSGDAAHKYARNKEYAEVCRRARGDD